jgi:tetratricopeptide (TPR) repeat protein
MMHKLLFYILLLCSVFSFSQNTTLADTFFSDGEYNKALIEYNKILTKQPYRTDLFIKKTKCYQELEQFNLAQKEFLNKLRKKNSPPELYVELGYNYTLQNDTINAKKAYSKALEIIEINSSHARVIGQTFEKYNLLSEAEDTYNKAMILNEHLNFDFQLANIYGQQNNIEKMFDSYLKLIKKNKAITTTVQNLIGKFLSDDPKNKNNVLLKRALLKKLQNSQDTFWNEQLSWLFVQQKEFKKAFIQEKAIFKREDQTLHRLFELGVLAKRKNQLEASQNIFEFIRKQPLEIKTRISVIAFLLDMKQETGQKKDFDSIVDEYKKALDSFGVNNKTLQLQLAYVDFLAFKKHDIQKALHFLETHENQSLSRFEKATYQMKMADIFVADGQFNHALINYSKIQRHLKNNVLSQEARFKVAKTSYYKGDFNWALQQLKILKTSTSQLIANDALDLHLLINDHINEDTLHVALKKYAKADLLAFQNKPDDAIAALTDILNLHPVNKIIDDTLFLQGKLYELQHEFTKAIHNYERIVNTLKESIFVDDALFRLAMLNLNQLNNRKKASEYFEVLLFNHADSIHFIEAQKMYRKLQENTSNNS